MTRRPPERVPESHSELVPESYWELVPKSRWALVCDVIVFQGKLIVDGVRDALLMPISIVAAIMDLLGIGRRAGRNFYDVILLGRETEHWINLFGAADRLLPGSADESPPSGLDVLVRRMEDVVVEEYERGGITASAKDAVDRAIDKLQRPK